MSELVVSSRDALAKAIKKNVRAFEGRDFDPTWDYTDDARNLADALLASGVVRPLPDEETVAQVITPASRWMGHNYTPTVEVMRDVYVRAGTAVPEFLEATRNRRQAEFDRFIAQVKAEALEEAAEKIRLHRATVGTSGSQRDDESWDNGNSSAEATVRKVAAEYRSGVRK